VPALRWSLLSGFGLWLRWRVQLRRFLLRFLQQLQRELQFPVAALQLFQFGALAREHADQMFEL
jgi:hypothetical protein